MTALRPGTSPPPVRMPMRLLTMPTSQDWHVVIIGGPLAIRHRRAAKARKIAIGIIADRVPLEPSPQAGPPREGAASARNYRITPKSVKRLLLRCMSPLLARLRHAGGCSSCLLKGEDRKWRA